MFIYRCSLLYYDKKSFNVIAIGINTGLGLLYPTKVFSCTKITQFLIACIDMFLNDTSVDFLSYFSPRYIYKVYKQYSLYETQITIYRLIARDPQSIMRPTYYLVLTTTVLLPFPRKLYSGISAAAVIMLDIMLSNLSDLQEKTVIVVCIKYQVTY